VLIVAGRTHRAREPLSARHPGAADRDRRLRGPGRGVDGDDLIVEAQRRVCRRTIGSHRDGRHVTVGADRDRRAGGLGRRAVREHVTGPGHRVRAAGIDGLPVRRWRQRIVHRDARDNAVRRGPDHGHDAVEKAGDIDEPAIGGHHHGRRRGSQPEGPAHRAGSGLDASEQHLKPSTATVATTPLRILARLSAPGRRPLWR
jgi:hypothetical protein